MADAPTTDGPVQPAFLRELFFAVLERLFSTLRRSASIRSSTSPFSPLSSPNVASVSMVSPCSSLASIS